MSGSEEVEGRAKGGVARARSLTRDRRSEIARLAAITRWGEEGKLRIAKYGAADRPVRIGPVDIPCYVLDDGTRLLAQRGLQGGIGLSLGGGKSGARRIAELMESLAEKGIDVRDLVARANGPIRFIPPHGGNPADGYEATILPDICAVLIEAHQQGKLGKHREHLATRAALLQHGFATLGIIGLVDEATGYQEVRDREALQAILDKFLRKELAAWAKRFPDEFYKEMFRLRGWRWLSISGKRPRHVGNLTNDLIYDRLAPGILAELESRNPKDEHGRRQRKHHQWLTEDVGHPALAQHLHAVTGFMRASSTWDQFYRLMNRAFPKRGRTLELPLGD
jgi:P63C domain-containing protein